MLQRKAKINNFKESHKLLNVKIRAVFATTCNSHIITKNCSAHLAMYENQHGQKLAMIVCQDQGIDLCPIIAVKV